MKACVPTKGVLGFRNLCKKLWNKHKLFSFFSFFNVNGSVRIKLQYYHPH